MTILFEIFEIWKYWCSSKFEVLKSGCWVWANPKTESKITGDHVGGKVEENWANG